MREACPLCAMYLHRRSSNQLAVNQAGPGQAEAARALPGQKADPFRDNMRRRIRDDIKIEQQSLESDGK